MTIRPFCEAPLKLKFLKAQQSLFHFFFILTLCCVHWGLHFVDFIFLQSHQNFFEGALILTSMDAYHYAKGVREFLSLLGLGWDWRGVFDAFLSLHPLAILGGILAKMTSLDFALSWSSVIFSTTTAVALYWLVYQILALLNFAIFKKKQSQNTSQYPLDSPFLAPLILAFLAFVGSLVAILSPSFYQRVGVGYFDTDMLLLTFPLLAFVCLLRFLGQKRLSLAWLVWFGIFSYLAVIWHNGIQNLLLLGFLLFVCLEVARFVQLRTISPKALILASTFLILLTPTPFSLWVFFVVLFEISKRPKNLWIWLIFTLIYAAIFGLLNPVFAQINAYLFGATQHANTYIYASVVKTILETSPTSWEIFINRSGGIVLFGIAFFGFVCFGVYGFCVKFGLRCVVLSRKKPKSDSLADSTEDMQMDSKESESVECFFEIFLFLLPFCVLGFGSLMLGARFSLFLIPMIALGFAVFCFGILKLYGRFFSSILIANSLIVALLIANLHYQIPQPILTQVEIKAFKELDSKLNPQDILLSWWDYGYALRYFTKGQVLLDGARHSGVVNFPIAKILMSSSPTLFYSFSSHLAQAMQTLPTKQWNQIFEVLSLPLGANAYLQSLEVESPKFELVNGAKVYWVLPLRILPLLANVNVFANVDLENGKVLQKDFFMFWDSTQNAPNIVPQATIDFYNDFYIMQSNAQNPTNLTQVNFGKNSFLLSNHYLKSNMIQILLFQNYPNGISGINNGNIVRILQLN